MLEAGFALAVSHLTALALIPALVKAALVATLIEDTLILIATLVRVATLILKSSGILMPLESWSMLRSLSTRPQWRRYLSTSPTGLRRVTISERAQRQATAKTTALARS